MSEESRQAWKDLGWKLAAPLVFIGAVALALPTLFRKRGFRKREVLYYLDLCGVRSVPIVILICLLMGAVMGIQAALQLRKVGKIGRAHV